jgi:hypothetical protein
MFKTFFGSTLATIFTAILIAAVTFSSPVNAASKATVAADYGKLPLVFEANQGQTDASVKFLSRGPGYSLFLTESEAVLSLRGADDKSQALRMKLLGAAAAPKMTGLDRLPGVSNYFIGRDRSKWRTGEPHYARVGYEGVYPGIDLVFYGTTQRRLEYDFVVAPGADPSQIALGFEGAERLEIDAKGDLVAQLAAGEVRFLKPVIYQEENGKRQDVEGKYTLTDGNRVGFQVASYNPNKPLIIDPVLAYSTYLGGTDIEESIRSIALDSAGNAHITGRTRSTDFPVVNAYQQTCTVPEVGGCFDVFVAKLNSDGSDLIYATYLGAGGGTGIAVNSDEYAYVVGSGSSTPTTGGAFEESGPGAFFVKLDQDGKLVYGTYLLGGGASEIAVDSMDRAVIVGQVGPDSDVFPTTEGAFDRSCGDDIDVTDCDHVTDDTFLAVIDPDDGDFDPQNDLVYSTFLGGTADDDVTGVAADGGGLIYLIGYTKSSDFPTTAGAIQEAPLSLDLSAVFTVINPAGNGADDLFYSTYLGGDGRTIGRDVDIIPGCESPCRAYLTGDTSADTFPTTLNSVVPFPVTGYETFVSLIDPAGNGSADLFYSTFFGGTGGWAIAAGSDGKVYVSGQVLGQIPTRHAIQGVNMGSGDSFVAVIDPTSNGLDGLLFADYLGGTGTETGRAIAVDGSGEEGDPFSLYVAGNTRSPDFPTNAEAFQPELRTPPKKKGRPSEQANAPDAFIAKIEGPFDATGPVVDAPSNFKPIAVADEYPDAEENVTLIVPTLTGLLANDSDPDHGPLDPLVVNGNNNPDNGTVIVYADGSFEYTPDLGFFGTDTFRYAAFDGQDSDIATVTIEVVSLSNHLPVAADDLYAASVAPDFLAIIGEEIIVPGPGVLGNDQDSDGDPLTAELLSPPTPPNDFVLMDDGGFTYTPNVAGTVEFSYRADDLKGGVSDPATVTIVVSDGTMHIGALSGISWGPKSGSFWIGRPEVVLHQGGGSENIVADGVRVVFGWEDSLGQTGTVECITNGIGQCAVEITFDRPVSEATFTVNTAEHNGDVLTYKLEDNHDPEGEPPSITLFKSRIWCFNVPSCT